MTTYQAANGIVGAARAVFGLLQPGTGERATGSVTATATGADLSLPRNSYLLPVVDGALRHELAFKVGPGPNADESWTVTAGGTAVSILSNLGGPRHNLPAATVFRWDPPIPGLEATATSAAGTTGATETLIRQIALYEQLDSADPQRSFFEGSFGRYPAGMLVWEGSDPIEGRTVGQNQGATRKGRGRRAFRETFALYLATGRVAGDSERRAEGLDCLETATQLLTDRARNNDGEQVSYQGALEVLGRQRVIRGPRLYVYSIRFRLVRIYVAVDFRTFGPLEKFHYRHSLEADPPLAESDLVDLIEPNT